MKSSAHEKHARQRRRLLGAGVTAVAALAALSFARRSHSATDRVMRILCSGPAGSIPDLVARAIGEQLSLTLGQPVIVDDRPGPPAA
jgi:tripartite-type tricarboxylate transporter receptor subunit TctC